MSSTQAQTPARITPAGIGNNPTNISSPPSAPVKSVTSGPVIAACPPGQIKDSSGNCVSPTSAVQSAIQRQAPATPAVNLTAPKPTVQTPAPTSASPAKAAVKSPTFNTHVQQQQAGGANPPSLTPPAPGGAASGAGAPTGTPPTTPTIPPSQIPAPTPQPAKPIPPTQVQPRQQPPTPPIPHPPQQRPIPFAQRTPGDFDRKFPIRTFQKFPNLFHDFDHRFDDDRRRFDCDDFREEFDDDDDRRFRPFIERSSCANIRLIEHILGIVYDPISSALGRDIPTGPGIWVIGVDGQWYRVVQCDNDLIVQIETTRMVDRHDPIIIGGGIGLQTGNVQQGQGNISIPALATIAIGLGIIYWVSGGKR